MCSSGSQVLSRLSQHACRRESRAERDRDVIREAAARPVRPPRGRRGPGWAMGEGTGGVFLAPGHRSRPAGSSVGIVRTGGQRFGTVLEQRGGLRFADS
jgi:hypothetical protein